MATCDQRSKLRTRSQLPVYKVTRLPDFCPVLIATTRHVVLTSKQIPVRMQDTAEPPRQPDQRPGLWGFETCRSGTPTPERRKTRFIRCLPALHIGLYVTLQSDGRVELLHITNQFSTRKPGAKATCITQNHTVLCSPSLKALACFSRADRCLRPVKQASFRRSQENESMTFRTLASASLSRCGPHDPQYSTGPNGSACSMERPLEELLPKNRM